MGPITWVIFGGLAGWVASLIAGTGRRQGCILNVVVGIVGAMIGGALMEFLTGRAISFQLFSPLSFGVAVVGALVLLALVNMAQRRR
ncbi:MAG: GlsB/YeaQ/YmgE family stress response membrane protein [Chloroflexales bacterium]